jgi:hypothetical protein
MLVIPEAFPETYQEIAQRCNDAATKRFLTGQQRKNFLNRCMSAGSQPDLTPDQQKLKNCNDVPKEKNFTAEQRKNLMKNCQKQTSSFSTSPGFC